MNLNDFLRSGFDFSDKEYELRLRYLLLNSVLGIVSAMLALLSLLRFYQESYLQFSIDLLFVFISIFAIFYIKKTKRRAQKATLPLLLLFFVLVSVSFANTNMHLVGASWFIVIIIPAYYLGDLKIGNLITFSSILSIFILGLMGEKGYSFIEFTYVLIPMLISAIFIYVYEKRIGMAKKLLEDKNFSLAKEVEIKTAEENVLLQNNKELAEVISKSNIELFIVDYETDAYLYVNQGGINALGYSLEELQTMTVYDTNPSLSVEAVNKLKSLKDTVPNIMNIAQHQRKDGSTYGVQSLIHTLTYHGREAYAIYDVNLTDVHVAQNQLLEQKEKLLQQAHYDSLTKLPNRVLFSDRFNQAVAKAHRSKKEFAILFIDLDKFKEINDTLGHNVGDLVLQEIAIRFKKSLREEDTVSRFGGDEFVCLIESLDSCAMAATLAQKLISRVKEPLIIEEKTIQLTCSIGISVYDRDADDEKTLLHKADTAMYRAKDLGKDNYQFYSSC